MKFAVILSGCGNLDGAEIHESVTTLLAIDRAGASYECFAPDKEQKGVVNFVTKTETNEKRNVLEESARIARGDIKDLKDFNINNFDAVIFPGGFGVAKNLSTFAFEGENFNVISEIEKIINDAYNNRKPIGALCISPVIISKVLKGSTVTIGQDDDTAKIIEKLGGNHKKTNIGEIVVDEKYKVVTAPCYMLNATIKDIADEAEKVVNKMMELI